MPTLSWIGKEAVVDHHRRVPTRLLECDRELSIGDPSAENLLVEGDNLEALKALLPRFRGQVKCIYIDPPYNTGNEEWRYNDNVNDPRIRKWLGDVVGKEAEDLCRHDKWLCMMYPRLALLREFLRDDGIIFVSIDENEVSNCRAMLDEIYGPRCRVGALAWKSRHFVDARPTTGISEDHEHIIVYGKTPTARLRGQAKDYTKYKNPDNDPRGPWTSCSLLGKATAEQRPNLHYCFIDPVTGAKFDCPDRTGWICAHDTMEWYARDRRLLYPKKPNGRLRQKVFQSELKSEYMGFASVIADFSTSDGTEELRALLGDQAFSFPKPSALIAELIIQASSDNSIVMDSFAGSGTTGHATLLANESDGGTRTCILVEIDPVISKDITRRRLLSVVDGGTDFRPKKEVLYERPLTPRDLNRVPEYLDEIESIRGELASTYESTSVELADKKIRLLGKTTQRSRRKGLGDGFRYCRLGRTLLDERGNINVDVPFADLARFVYLLETGVPIPKRPQKNCSLLGIHRGRAIYLLYNGVLGDRRPTGGNVLTSKVLAELPEPSESETSSGEFERVVYGEACRLGEATLRRERVKFRQVPYSLRET